METEEVDKAFKKKSGELHLTTCMGLDATSLAYIYPYFAQSYIQTTYKSQTTIIHRCVIPLETIALAKAAWWCVRKKEPCFRGNGR